MIFSAGFLCYFQNRPNIHRHIMDAQIFNRWYIDLNTLRAGNTQRTGDLKTNCSSMYCGLQYTAVYPVIRKNPINVKISNSSEEQDMNN
jgi:hypothetical protein